MSWSRRASRSFYIALTLSAGLALSACSFSPVYSGTLTSQPTLNLAYGKPSSRLEQIVYQELSLRLGSTSSETAPLAMATVSTSTRNVTQSRTANPNRSVEVTATVTLTITPRDGTSRDSQSFTRTATATYTTSNQVLANNAAATEASERAAKAAAESLRLAILASLSRG